MSMKHKYPQVQPGDKAQVQQHFKDDADLNRQFAQHVRGAGRFGAPIGNPNATRKPQFLDLSDSRSYHDMLNTVTAIDQMFSRLPARLRSRFKGRPELLMAFIEDPGNTKEAVKLGLIDDPEVIQAVREAEANALRQKEANADKEAQEAAEEAHRADPEAQPTHKKVRKSPEGD